MPRITKPLTNTEVKQAKHKDKMYKLLDGGGLQLRVMPNGSKLWLLDYKRPFTKVRTTLSIGQYPDISLAEARAEREKTKKLLTKHVDPKDHRDYANHKENAASANTLENIAAQWLEVKRSKISEGHASDTWRSLELHIFPNLGKVPAHKLTAVKTIAVIKPVAAKGSLETVKRLCQRLNEIMVYATNTGIIDTNPLSGIAQAFQSPQKTHLPTIKPDELPTLMSKLAVASIKLTTRSVIEWQLHTMVRPNEAAGTRWNEIDLKNKLWTIPAARMKRKREHKVPLSDQSIALLELMRPISGHRDFVFISDRNPKFSLNTQTANMALKRMGYGGTLVAHGLRALASTTLNEQGFDPDIIESALSHVGKNEIRNAYNRADYLKRRAPMMGWWSNHIEEAAKGNFNLGSNKSPLELVIG